jgi:ATP-dependent DNA helicase RecG
LLGGQVVESERIEFKEGWNPLSVLHTLCAFANDFHNLGGGYILIGIAEKNGVAILPPVGLDSYEINRIQKELLQLSHESIRPHHHPAVALCEFDGATVLLLRVFGGLYRPYKARLSLAKDGHDWGYFIRKGSSTVRAKDHDEMELLSLAATVPFDDLINQRAQVSDLSRDLIRAYLLEVKSDLASHVDRLDPVALGRQMNIVTGPTEDVLPINVGLLFFNPEPWRFFPVAQIDVVWFPRARAVTISRRRSFAALSII